MQIRADEPRSLLLLRISVPLDDVIDVLAKRPVDVPVRRRLRVQVDRARVHAVPADVVHLGHHDVICVDLSHVRNMTLATSWC
jgi:hypothetical protein